MSYDRLYNWCPASENLTILSQCYVYYTYTVHMYMIKSCKMHMYMQRKTKADKAYMYVQMHVVTGHAAVPYACIVQVHTVCRYRHSVRDACGRAHCGQGQVHVGAGHAEVRWCLGTDPTQNWNSENGHRYSQHILWLSGCGEEVVHGMIMHTAGGQTCRLEEWAGETVVHSSWFLDE